MGFEIVKCKAILAQFVTTYSFSKSFTALSIAGIIVLFGSVLETIEKLMELFHTQSISSIRFVMV